MHKAAKSRFCLLGDPALGVQKSLSVMKQWTFWKSVYTLQDSQAEKKGNAILLKNQHKRRTLIRA